MTIDYYYINEYGEIRKGEIDTTDREYVAHNDLQVFVKGYMYGSKITHSRVLDVVKQDLIKQLKERIREVEQLHEIHVY